MNDKGINNYSKVKKPADTTLTKRPKLTSFLLISCMESATTSLVVFPPNALPKSSHEEKSDKVILRDFL